MRYILSNLYTYRENGFGLVDIMITFSLIFLLAGLSTPSITKFVDSYKFRMAVSDLLSYMYRAKSISAKGNVEVSFDFNPIQFVGYILEDSNNNILARVNFDDCHNKNQVFARCYNGNIIYKSPIEGEIANPGKLTIKPNGLSKRGFAYITNREQNKYYRVGILSASGLIGIEKWNGSEWE
jgi:hypothetical protein